MELPAFSEKLLAGQSVHDPSPSAPAYLPGGQLRHVASLVASTADEYVPVGHVVHLGLAGALENDPGGQDVQAALLVAPVAGRYFPSGQLVHCALPDASCVYVPTGHVVQDVLSIDE